jgi:hypothetical protein
MNNPFLLACVLLFAGGVQSEAQAQAQACWAASVMDRVSMDELPMTHPRYAPLHAAMDTLEALVRPNPGLLALPEVRLRIRRDIHGGSQDAGRATAAVIHAQGFGPKTWGRGECELIPQADRIGPRAGISFFINKPRLAHLRRMCRAQPGAPAALGGGECGRDAGLRDPRATAQARGL